MVDGNLLETTADLARRAALLSHRAIRLRHQADDGMYAGQERLEGRLGKRARSHHDQTHGLSRAHASASSAVSSFSMSASGGISPRSWARR